MPTQTPGRAMSWFTSLTLATALATAVGAFVQRHLSFEIVSLEGLGPWAWLAWPAVLLALGATALVVVSLPVGLVLGSRSRDPRVNLALRTGVETLLGTLLFRLVSFPISAGETVLVALPQVVLFGTYHVLRGRCGERREPGSALSDSGGVS